MPKTEDGGPAFPRPASVDPEMGTLPDGDEVVSEQTGMSLRDYFAGSALTGLLAFSPPETPGQYDAQTAAEMSYRMADAMLAARGA